MTLTVQDLVLAAKQNVQEISMERLLALQTLGGFNAWVAAEEPTRCVVSP